MSWEPDGCAFVNIYVNVSIDASQHRRSGLLPRRSLWQAPLHAALLQCCAAAPRARQLHAMTALDLQPII